MADRKKVVDETLSIINAALTILEKFPEFDETSTFAVSSSASVNPFDFLIDLFKSTAGYDKFLKIISSFIALGLPALELSIKGVLLTNLKNLISCSLNPIISKELILNGITFDLRTIDIMNMLSYSPFDKKGKYQYFGCEGFDCTSQLVRAGDFNAFLWYVKNQSLRRNVWYGVNIIKSNVDSLMYTDDEGNSVVVQKTPKDNNLPTRHDVDDKGNPKKCKKSQGIITLQYRERPSSLRNADGSGKSYLQTPHNHCLQVFLGNTQDTDRTITDLENEIEFIDLDIALKKEEIEGLEDELNSVMADVEKLVVQYQEQTVDKDYYEREYKSLIEEQEELINDIQTKREQINSVVEEKQTKEIELRSRIANLDSTENYRKCEQNYYYKHTLLEFNTDYIMSLKLFDSKTIVAQLIDALTGCFSIDMKLSYEQLLVKYETQKMVKAIIETDDAVVSDCFFTFSNDEYDKMLQKAELSREELYAMTPDNPTGVKVNAEDILNSLNTINEGSSKETVQSVIEGSLTEISKTLSDVDYEYTDKVNFGAEINFIENIMNNLAYIITMCILSPKLYLLLAVNLQLLGQQSNFSIDEFIEKHKQMIIQILRAVRDEIINYLVGELMKLLEDLAKEVSIKLTIEQAQYYARLIKKIIDCFNRNSEGLDFNIDNVDYSDIYEQEETPKDDEC